MLISFEHTSIYPGEYDLKNLAEQLIANFCK